MPSSDRNNNSNGNQTFGRVPSGLWHQYGADSPCAIAISGRNRTRSLCEPYAMKLIDTNMTAICRRNPLRKYPSVESMPAAKSNARSNDNDKENASSVSITPSEIVKKWMALNAATPNLEPAESRTVAEMPDTNVRPCNFDQGLSVPTATNALYASHGSDGGIASDDEIKANTAATLARDGDAQHSIDNDVEVDECIVNQQKEKVSELRRCSRELERLDGKLEWLKSKANTME